MGLTAFQQAILFLVPALAPGITSEELARKHFRIADSLNSGHRAAVSRTCWSLWKSGLVYMVKDDSLSGRPRWLRHLPDYLEVPQTARGFRIFCKKFTDKNGHAVSVVESSLAFEGPHVRVYVGDACAHLTIEQASSVASALQQFIAEARGGQLTEKP